MAAPSADNHHMFRLVANDNAFTLVASSAWQAADAHRKILGLIAMGAVIENLVLRGRRLGLRLHRSSPDFVGSQDTIFARFECQEADAADDPLEMEIERRHSNRRFFFHGPVLPVEAQRQLSRHSTEVPGTQLIWLDTHERRRKATRLIGWAETERFRLEELHRELFDSIRFDAGWTKNVTEGLPPGALAIPWLERPAFTALRNWRLQCAMNLLGMHHFIGLRAAAWPCRLAPHLCAVVVEGDASTAPVRAGQLLQRVWLQASHLGLAFQVYAAAALYALDGFAPLPDELRSRMVGTWRELCPDGKPYLVFRMGYAKLPSMQAGRPPASVLLGP